MSSIGGFIWYFIEWALLFILLLIVIIPAAVWEFSTKGIEQEVLILTLSCAAAWLALRLSPEVDFARVRTSLVGHSRVAALSMLGMTVRIARNTYYNVMEIILRPKPAHSPTKEREFVMPDPPDFIDVEASDGDQSTRFRATLMKFHRQAKDVLPDIPSLPVHSSDYEGWFAQTKKIIAMRRQTMAANQQLELVRSFTNLYAEYHNLSEVLLKIQKNKNEMEREKERTNLVNMQMEVERLELEAKKTEHELAIARNKAEMEKISKPAPVSRLEQKEEELKEAELDARLQKLRTPSTPPTPVERYERELSEFKDVEEWRKSWPTNMTPEEKAIRERVYNAKRMSIMEKIKT